MGAGFERAEIAARIRRAQAAMAKADLAALLLTTEPEVRYFTGFLTRFWESPTRPWYLIIPPKGDPIAVIPSIGKPLMARSGVGDIRTWAAPDLMDDGVTLLADTLCELVADGDQIGVPGGHVTHLRMPMQDFKTVQKLIGARKMTGDDGIVRALRMVKSPAEIDKIETACAIAGRAFDRVPEIASKGQRLDEIFRRFQMLCLEEGADWVPYVAGAAEMGGYDDVISPATPKALETGDVLMLDTGLVHDGYFCDFDRNWSVGAPSTAVDEAYRKLKDATHAAFETARPGATASDLYVAMATSLGAETDAGRLGHGLGMSLTEWPSLIATDHTQLLEGMVLTLEPGVPVGDKILVHEENIAITADGARWLSPIADQRIPVI